MLTVRPGQDCLRALIIYATISLPAHLAWETAQMPLYTLWRTGTLSEIAFAIAHCTAGDVLIALLSLAPPALLLGRSRWPHEHFGNVAIVAIMIGIAYTIFSEWLNVVVKHTWAYSDLMPTMPGLGTGLSPVLQWLVVPTATLFAVRKMN